jgi:hypothetical protein
LAPRSKKIIKKTIRRLSTRVRRTAAATATTKILQTTMKKTKTKTKFTRRSRSMPRGGRDGSKDMKISDMSLEEVELELAAMETEPTCTAGTAGAESMTLAMLPTGLSEEEILAFADTSAISHDLDLSGAEETRAEEEKEEVVEAEQQDAAMEQSFDDSDAEPTQEALKKPMGKSSLSVAAAKGEAQKRGGGRQEPG